MPIISHNDLPSYDRLRREGMTVLDREKAAGQHIRELHVGLLNMMPDAALAATERQFFRLVGESNPIAQFYMHPFTFEEIKRAPEARRHVENYYESFDSLKTQGLDALIITGANVIGPNLAEQPFWDPLIRVIDWAAENVTSTLCSCLATHAVLDFRYGKKRKLQNKKIWGVFPHYVADQSHPLVNDVNTRFDVPHSHWNDIDREQFEAAGLHVLVTSEQAGVHMATSEDGLRFVFLQGHPEYDTVSLLKEFKREVRRWAAGEDDYPPFPENYLYRCEKALLDEYRLIADQALKHNTALPEFPEKRVAERLENTWHDTGEAIIGNWMGCVYQVTHNDRRIPFMEGVDPDDPLGRK